MMTFRSSVLAVVAGMMLSGCASVSLVDSWKSPGSTAKHYRKLLVVGVADKVQTREVFEEVFASEIRKNKIAAVPSYTLTSYGAKPTKESLEGAVIKSGADGVITTRMVSLKKDIQVHTGYVMNDRGYTNAAFLSPDFYPADLYGFYGASVSYASFSHQAVDVTVSTKYTIETNLFDAVSGKLVWSCTTSAVKPEGLITASSQVSEVVIRSMIAAGLI